MLGAAGLLPLFAAVAGVAEAVLAGPADVLVGSRGGFLAVEAAAGLLGTAPDAFATATLLPAAAAFWDALLLVTREEDVPGRGLDIAAPPAGLPLRCVLESTVFGFTFATGLPLTSGAAAPAVSVSANS